MRMKRNLIVAITVLIFAGVTVYQHISAKEREVAAIADVKTKAGSSAPAFQLEALDGQTYQVGGPRQKPLILNFWASWCGPCEEETPELQAMFDKYKNQLDLYGVNVTKNDILSDAKAMVNQYHLSYPILLDKEGKAAALYDFQIIPTSFLIDRNGNIVDVVHMLDEKDWEHKIKSLIDR